MPIGAITIVSVALLVKITQKAETKTVKQRLAQIDFIGASFLLPAVICFLLALQWGGNTYAWNSSKIIGLFIGAGLLSIIFIAIQLKQQDLATLPPRIVRKRSVWAAGGFGFMFGGGFFIMAYFIPLYFQAIRGSTAVHSGLQLLPLMISVVLSSIVAGGAITKIGYYTPFLIGGAVLMTIGAGLVTTWKINSSTGIWFGFQVIMGLGAGGSFQIPLIAIQTVLDLKDVPSGIALVSFTQNLGGAVFIAVAQALFSNNLENGLRSRIADPVAVSSIISSGATGFRKAIDAALLPSILEAYIVALASAFKVSVVAIALAVVFACCVEFRSVKSKEGVDMTIAA